MSQPDHLPEQRKHPLQTHRLDQLLKLVDTAYYQQEGNRAVCEVLGQADEHCMIITLFVNGQRVSIDRGSIQAIVGKHHLRVEGWTTRPQLQDGG